VSSVIALKYNEDDIYSNKYYASVGGISMKELYALEVEFLKLINYSLFISDDLYEKYKGYLKKYCKSN
jgi:hypothetical protein